MAAAVGPPDRGGVMTLSIAGTFDGQLFRLFFTLVNSGGSGIVWGLGGLHLLMPPSPLPVDLTVDSPARQFARRPVVRGNSGNIEGSAAASSISDEAYLQGCFFDSGPAATRAKTPPIFLGGHN